MPPRRSGEELRIYDGRPNGEMVLATGTVERDNPADYLTMQARPSSPHLVLPRAVQQPAAPPPRQLCAGADLS